MERTSADDRELVAEWQAAAGPVAGGIASCPGCGGLLVVRDNVTSHDPPGGCRWFVQQLAEAAAIGERVEGLSILKRQP